jgi:hypothetical protein
MVAPSCYLLDLSHRPVGRIRTVPRRFLALGLAGAFIGVSVYLGIRAAADPGFVIWFGLATAILAPAAFQLIAIALVPTDTTLMRRLSSVPRIEELMAQAETEQERVRVLEDERARLAEIIRLEARRESLAQRHEGLLEDAARLLVDLETVEAEQAALSHEVGDGAALPEIEALRGRLAARRRGDLVLSFRGREYIVDPRTFDVYTPFLGRAPGWLMSSFVAGLAQVQQRSRARASKAGE